MKSLPARTVRRSAAALALLSACTRAPTPSPAPAAEPARAEVAPLDTVEASRRRAVALLERSARALGGLERVRGLAAFEIAIESRAARGGWQQARRWTDTMPNPTPTPLRYLVDLERDRATFEFLSTSPGEIRFNYLAGYDTTGMWQVDLLRWRQGDDIARGDARAARNNLAAAARVLPQGAVRQALLRGDSLRWLGARTLEGRRAEAVSYVERTSRQRVEIAIDSATALPAMISAPGASLTYDDYRPVDGLPIPHRRRQLANGVLTAVQEVTRVVLTPVRDDRRFAIPQGFADAPPAGSPRATRLANGVYRLDQMPGGYHAAFVVHREGVAVLEAPTSAAYSEAALRLIADSVPGRAVTHVFVTHHHNDHVGGLAPYVARGALLVVGAGLEEAVRRQLPDSLRARARFEPVASARTFFEGDARVTVVPIANTHADGNLAFHLPASRVLFQGDLFYIPERGDIPPAFPVTQSLVDAVRAAGLTVDRVVGVHGRSGTWAEVEESLRRQVRPTVPVSRP